MRAKFGKQMMTEERVSEKAVQADPSVYWKCWSLQSERGRQVWHFKYPESVRSEAERKTFLEEMEAAFRYDKSANANTSDLVFRNGKIPVSPTGFSEPVSGGPKSEAQEAFEKGTDFYLGLQEADGH